MASSLNNKNSRYVAGGYTDILPNKLGWWERRILPKQNDDIEVTITGPLVGRPDLIANLVYGNAQYAWMVLLYNTILEIDEELAEGKVITLPAHYRVY